MFRQLFVELYRESGESLRKRRTLDLIVTAIRCVPLKRDHPSSLIQIPKFRERPWIVPPEVPDGLYVLARALSPKE